jgi:hypothetical protein
MLRRHLTRTRLGVVAAVAVGVLLGAVVGQPGAGRAASTAVPKNTALPTISGSAVVGETLVATRGTWSGNPTSFRFAWNRCDANGAACLAIGGANAKIYTLTGSDVGHTLRVTVTAKNSSGSANATSAATSPVPVSGCPLGTGTIQVSDLSPPARLEISAGSVAPQLTRSTNTISLHIGVQACGNRPVQGVTVYATAIPYNQFAGEQATTGADGTVTLTEPRRSGFPAARHQRLLAVFVRATKPGESELAGVSTRRVLAFPISHG